MIGGQHFLEPGADVSADIWRKWGADDFLTAAMVCDDRIGMGNGERDPGQRGRVRAQPQMGHDGVAGDDQPVDSLEMGFDQCPDQVGRHRRKVVNAGEHIRTPGPLGIAPGQFLHHSPRIVQQGQYHSRRADVQGG